MLTETEEVVIRHYRVRAFHEGCGGEWFSTGAGLSNSVRTMTEHKCRSCNDKAMFEQSFPRIDQKVFPLDYTG